MTVWIPHRLLRIRNLVAIHPEFGLPPPIHAEWTIAEAQWEEPQLLRRRAEVAAMLQYPVEEEQRLGRRAEPPVLP